MRTLSTAVCVLFALGLLGLVNETQFEKEVTVGAPVVAGNLAVFPLAPRQLVDDAQYLVLDEAFREKVLVVHETSEGGSVNALHVSNFGDRPVFAVAGELLLGGKQDRIVGQSTVIPPRAQRLAVPVFCVEHGRWSGGKAEFESGNALGHVSLRKKALFGDQSGVWGEVASSNAALHTENTTDTYREAAKKLAAETEARTRQIIAALDKVPKVSGLAVAINGQIEAVEYFRSPALFAKLREKMVASYAAESIRRPAAANFAVPTAKDIVAFMTRAEAAKQSRTKTSAYGVSVDFEDATVMGEHVYESGKPAPVQKSYFAQ